MYCIITSFILYKSTRQRVDIDIARAEYISMFAKNHQKLLTHTLNQQDLMSDKDIGQKVNNSL